MLKHIKISLFMLAALSIVCVPLNALAEDSQKTRPKIGVALGGGGALGFAHIGVLRVLEEAGVPVDYIAGTSMGAIVAGLYASGMSPDEMEAMVMGIDWWDILRDKTARRQLNFRRKKDDLRYLFNFELGLKGFSLVLPNGLSAGQKLNNLLETETINVASAPDFDHFNIPFRAIGTDMRTAEPVVIKDGSLSTAMRASMAVPGIFSPVESDGRILCDGGLVNNIPVDVVRSMGADIVIAVDVGGFAADGEDSDLSSISGILNRTYVIMRRPLQEMQLKDADFVITPDLTGFTASMFHRSDGIIPCGTAAAKAQYKEIEKYADDNAFESFIKTQRAKNDTSGSISGVSIIGTDVVNEKQVAGRLKIAHGEEINFVSIHEQVARVYGMGDFQSVNYRIRPNGDDNARRLDVILQEKPWGPTYLHCGLRLQSDFDKTAVWDVLLNYSRRQLNDLGGELFVDLQGGRTQAIFAEFYQPLDYKGICFIAPSYTGISELQQLYENGEQIAEYEKHTSRVALDAGFQFQQVGEFRLGIASSALNADLRTGGQELPEFDADLFEFRARLTIDRLDAAVFPEDGYYLEINGSLARDTLGGDIEYDRCSVKMSTYESVGKHTFFGNALVGSSLKTDIPIYEQFTVGGVSTIAGLNSNQLRGNYFGVANLGYRYKIGKLAPSMGEDVFLIMRIDAGNAWTDRESVDEDDLIIGGLYGIGANTKFGPAFLGAGSAEGGEKSFYMALGTLF